MRLLAILLLVAGCPGALDRTSGIHDPTGDDGAGNLPECTTASQCAPAAATCCACPTFAVPTTDPANNACKGVMCPLPGPTCAANLHAACKGGACVLACDAVACTTSCADGYATDDNGCLTCACATIDQRACVADTDCARVRADCCGCQSGGSDTAVPVGEIQAHDLGLMCPQSPACPGVDTCPPDLVPRCVQGACELISGGLPSNACGRPDLMDCTNGEACTINYDDAATAEGVGVCVLM
jgi:hypothetical protein